MTNDVIKSASEWNHVGILFFAEKKWAEAVQAYQQAIMLKPDFVDAYYNLGLAYKKLGLIMEAKHTYYSLVNIMPAHAPARFQLALLLMQEKNFLLAIEHFLFILEQHVFHFETLVNIATCYLQLGKLLDAKSYYLQALELVSLDHQVLFNLGVIAMQLGRIQEAIKYYSSIVNQAIDEAHIDNEIRMSSYSAHYNLGVGYLILKDRSNALLHFHAALRLEPQNQSIQHLIHVIENRKSILSCPLEYIEKLFNSYADHYDAHLLQNLAYQLPALIRETIQAYAPLANYQWRILDLGCGTGLCAESLTSYGAKITGIDISEEMLKIAKTKLIYHKLIKMDILSFLQKTEETYDLIIVGDVIPYFGPLDMLFSLIKKRLAKTGLLIFNAEKSVGAEYEMTLTGRFIHHQTYLEKLFQINHFLIIHKEEIALRKQDEQLVMGYLYLLQLVD